MASEPTELRRINWGECFPFTHIFRTFRIAIHPSKLGLALVGLVVMGIWGSILDGIWSGKHQPLAGELNAYCTVPDIKAWREDTRTRQASLLREYHLAITGKPQEQFLDALKSDPVGTVDAELKALAARHKDDLKAIDKKRESGATNTEQELLSLGVRDNRLHREIKAMRPVGVFRALVAHEVGAVRQAVHSAIALDFVGNWEAVADARRTGGGRDGAGENLGVLGNFAIGARGFKWLVTQHPFYALLFGAVSLAIWSLVGGAICRMAAMNVAREERLSPRLAMEFASRKFLGFFTAPLLPVGAVIVVGFLITAGSFALLTWFFLFDLIGSIGIILALLGGFVIALLVIGGLAGGSLMWPTIAVEGSDGFDAFSRSYNYVISRPWRAAFYGAVASVYGGICFVFARFFVLLVLKAARFFVGLGLCWTDRPGTGIPGATKIETLWPEPTFMSLRGHSLAFGTQYWDSVDAWFIGLWILLATALLWSFLISFYLSGSTVIYYLLRREVDATDLEDVFVDEEEQAEQTTAPAVPAAAAAPAPPPVSPEPPPDTNPAPGPQ